MMKDFPISISIKTVKSLTWLAKYFYCKVCRKLDYEDLNNTYQKH